MTKTLARDICRQRRPGGYFSPGEPGIHAGDYLLCPLCRDQVSLANRPYPRSLKAPNSREIDAALLLHLLDQYDDSRCTAVMSVRAGSEL